MERSSLSLAGASRDRLPILWAFVPLHEMKRVLPVAAAALACGFAAAWAPAHAQRAVPKIGLICPMGYVDMLNGNCSTLGLAYYTLQPTEGKPCPEGWFNVGGGYCRKK
ncbi:MAG: hypothetical protein VKK98_03530 [Cyanobacteriota bacterium]|nr:hypothetical protein [Cyanobacteriota bacterium]